MNRFYHINNSSRTVFCLWAYFKPIEIADWLDGNCHDEIME